MKKLLLTFGFLALAKILLATDVLACSCVGVQPPLYESFENADAVFVGTVSKLENVKSSIKIGGDDTVWLDNVFHFQVTESFKGVKGRTLKVNAGIKQSSCYSGFDVGASYLIFAGKGDEFFYSGFCSKKIESERAQAEIFFLRELLKGKPEPQIYGGIRRSDTFPGTDKLRATYLSGIKILIENKQARFETVTGKNGTFSFGNIPAGEYTLKPIVPQIYGKFVDRDIVFSISSDKKIRYFDVTGNYTDYTAHFFDIVVVWDNEISGKIYDAEGKIVKYACVKLLPIALANSQKDLTDKDDFDHDCDDNFSSSYNTPGNYILAVETYAPFGERNKIRTFYPQASSADKAQVFDLKADSKFNLDIKLLAAQNVRNIEGEIVWSNGVSLQDNAWAQLLASEIADDEKDWRYDWQRTDASGKFTLQGFENAEYWLHVGTQIDVVIDGKQDQIELKAKPIKVKAGKSVNNFKIVLHMPENMVN